MNLRLLHYLAFFAACAVVLRAAPSDDDDEDIDYLGYYSKSRDRVTFGYQFRQGAKVHFGNVGEVHPALASTNAAGQTLYAYTNGNLLTDILRANEKDANGNQTSTPGSRYTVLGTDSNGNPTVTGDYLSYTAGQTRNWSYNSLNQITPDGAHVQMSQYTATSNGASFDGSRKLSSGIELQLIRRLNSVDAKFGISLVTGFSLNGISSKTAGSVTSTLHVMTDTYATIGGQAVPTALTGTIYVQPYYTSFTQSDGTINPSGYEATVPLNGTPVSSVQKTLVTPANVTGIWRVNGAYYALRFGPQFTTQVYHSISLSAGLGLTGAYASTNDVADETLTVNIDGTDATTSVHDTSAASKLMLGYYANLDASWDANERTGFFAGLNYESLGSYDQKVSSRITKIDIGNTAGIRGGISIKF